MLFRSQVLAREIPRDQFRATPADRMLTGLRGKDVLLLFVESYGKVAVQGSSFSPRIDAVLDSGTAQLRAGGFSTRSAFLTSSTFGGLSWLAHSTLQSGIRIGTQRGYDQLVRSNRLEHPLPVALYGAFALTGNAVSVGVRVLRTKKRAGPHTHPWDLGLASIPAGEYLIEVTVKGTGGEVKELVPFRLTS